MKKLLLFCLCLLMFSVTQVFAQGRTITGTVTAKEDGLPIPGVTVKVKGTSNGTQTAANGGYSLKNVPAGATLTFSFIGYTPQDIPAGDKTTISAVLVVSAQQLNEVVVTSLGIARQARSLGYGVSKVTNEQVTQKSEPDLLKALQGKVAGVDIRASQGTPGAATRIQIRGNTSFQGDNQPLIIVDGIPYSNDQVTTTGQLTGGGAYSSGLSNLDPNDIASMNILKGSSGAALYGSRASNGVIIITTKSGSASRSKKGTEVTFKSSASIEQIANLPAYQNSYGAGSQGLYSNSNGSWGPAFSATPSAANGLLNVGGVTSIPAWGDYATAYPALFPGGTTPYVAYPNNVKDLFRNGAVYENSVNVSSGDEKNAISLTASQLNQNGYVPNSGFNRASVGLGGNSHLSNGLHVTGNLSYTRSNQIGGFFGENQVAGVPSEFARSLFLARNWDLNLPFETTSGVPLTPNGGGQFDNPRWSAKYNTATTAEERIIANGAADIDIAKIFNLSTRLGSNVNTLDRREVVEVGSRAAAGLGSMTVDNYRKQEIESTTLFTLKQRKLGDFTADAFVGFDFNQRTITRNKETGNIFIVKGLHNLTNTSQQIFNTDVFSRRRLFGALGQANFGYKDWAFVTFTGRNDWSSTLPASNRSYFYPAVLGSFVFTDALKIQSNILSYGKLRAAYSKVGRDTDPYETNNVFGIGSNFTGISTGSVSGAARDPLLQPEFTKELELGTELSFFDRRVDVDVTYYNKNSTNVIINVPTPASTGYSSFTTNSGEINNKGLEIELTVRPVRTKDFAWNLSGAFTRNINTVTKLKEGITRIDLGNVLTTLSTYAEAGAPYGYLRGTVNYRDANGNLLINPQSGALIEAADQAFIGNPNPKAKLGVTNEFRYKGFSLSALVDMTFGGDISSETINTELGRGVTKDTEDRNTSWVIPGVYGDANTGLPLLDGAGHEIPNVTRVTTNDLYFASGGASETFAVNGAGEWSVYDATVYRLREVTLGYTFPKTMLRKLPVGSVTLSVTGRNLFYYAPYMPKYSHFDPESNSFGASSIQGIEVSTAPTVRRYGVNLIVTF